MFMYQKEIDNLRQRAATLEGEHKKSAAKQSLLQTFYANHSKIWILRVRMAAKEKQGVPKKRKCPAAWCPAKTQNIQRHIIHAHKNLTPEERQSLLQAYHNEQTQIQPPKRPQPHQLSNILPEVRNVIKPTRGWTPTGCMPTP